MKKRKFLFIISNLEIGGTRRSLLNLLNAFSQIDDVQCDLLAFSPLGSFKKEVPEHVTVISSNMFLNAEFSSIQTLLLNKKFFLILYKIWFAFLKKFFSQKKIMKAKYIQHIETLSKDYDMAVGFQEGECNDYASLVPAAKIAFWIHNNFENLKTIARGWSESYAKADYINFVAEASMNTFKKHYPQFSKKMSVVKNILPQGIISKKAECIHTKLFRKDCPHLISVGRCSHQKGFDRLVNVAEKLKNNGYDFEWIVIGDGEQFNELKIAAEEKQLKGYVRFVGSLVNPYPHIKDADLYVMTSRYESQPMVLMEALTIGTPIISTAFDSVYEVAKNSECSIVVDNSTNGITTGVSALLSDLNKITAMKNATEKFIYDNNKIINQILHMAENKKC